MSALTDRQLLEALHQHVTAFGSQLTQQSANIEDLRTRFGDVEKCLVLVEQKAEEARAAAQLGHNRLAALEEPGGLLSNLAAGLFVISKDLQDLRAAVLQQEGHDVERRARLAALAR